MRILDAIHVPGAWTSDGGKRLRLTAALPLLLAFGLTACTATKSGTTISAPRTVEASQAMIVPAPGGPSVISVIEARFSDAVEQKVILATNATNAGQNFLSIRLYGPMERATQGEKKLGYASVTAVGLNNEALRAVPGVAMKTSTLFLRNSYGPFGYAFGQSAGGDSCIYGWQQLRAGEAERQSYRNSGAVQIRLRLCETGASEKELLAVMYGYTVTGSFASEQWNPFGSPKDVSDRIAGGDPIYPADAELKAPVETAVVQPRRLKPVAARQPEDAASDVVEDEAAAKRVVDVPAPLDSNPVAAVADEEMPADNSGASQVLVPGPGCQDGDASCN